MYPGEAIGDGRTRPPGFPQEFSDFPNPFQGLGIPGSSGFFDGFFSRNPFDDPFSIRPLGSMFGSTGGLFGPGGFMGMGGLLGNRRPDGAFLDQRPFHPPQGGSRKGPVIEELPDDHEDSPEKNRRGRQHPIVEHLDEDVTAAGITRQTRSQAEQEQFFQNSGYQSNPGYQSFSFQAPPRRLVVQEDLTFLHPQHHEE